MKKSFIWCITKKKKFIDNLKFNRSKKLIIVKF